MGNEAAPAFRALHFHLCPFASLKFCNIGLLVSIRFALDRYWRNTIRPGGVCLFYINDSAGHHLNRRDKKTSQHCLAPNTLDDLSRGCSGTGSLYLASQGRPQTANYLRNNHICISSNQTSIHQKNSRETTKTPQSQVTSNI